MNNTYILNYIHTTFELYMSKILKLYNIEEFKLHFSELLKQAQKKIKSDSELYYKLEFIIKDINYKAPELIGNYYKNFLARIVEPYISKDDELDIWFSSKCNKLVQETNWNDEKFSVTRFIIKFKQLLGETILKLDNNIDEALINKLNYTIRDIEYKAPEAVGNYYNKFLETIYIPFIEKNEQINKWLLIEFEILVKETDWKFY